MIDFNLTEFFLTGIVNYGALAIGLALFLGALGVPVPGTLLVLAAGAFIRQGVVDFTTAPGTGLLGVVLGDSAGYAIGYFAKGWLERRFGQSSAWQKAKKTFKQRGGIAIYFTRFLFTPLAVPTNLIAGGGGYSFWKFLLYVGSGQITWIVLYGGLGYVFGSQWEAISQFIADFSGLLVGVVLLGAGIYFIIRYQKRSQL